MAGVVKRGAYELGRALRETGQTIDRIGAFLQLEMAIGVKGTESTPQASYATRLPQLPSYYDTKSSGSS